MSDGLANIIRLTRPYSEQKQQNGPLLHRLAVQLLTSWVGLLPQLPACDVLAALLLSFFALPATFLVSVMAVFSLEKLVNR